MFSKIISLLFILFLFLSQTFAAGESDFPQNYYEIVAVILLIAIVVSLLFIIYFEGKTQVVKAKQASVSSGRTNLVTETYPVEKENESSTEHSYAGKREPDSKIPAWFSYVFIFTILFSAYYLLQYHLFGSGQSTKGVSSLEVKNVSSEEEALKNSDASVNKETVTQLTDPASLKLGKQIFETNCIACHATDGGGIVGPNLTDKYWLLGGGIKNVVHTVTFGVPDKGMISWQSTLNAKQIQEVASFVLSLQGTKCANPKAPEGEIWKEK